MKKKDYIFFAMLIMSTLFMKCNSHSERNHYSDNKNSEKRYDGYVPDETTAKKVAEAIWLPIYGESVLDEKPYKARIVGDSVWIVEGVLEKGKSGGTAYIEIRLKDCTVLKVTHGK